MTTSRPWDYETIEALCLRALDAVRGDLPGACYREARDMIRAHGEYGVAMELVIDCIDEADVAVTAFQVRAIDAVMAAMGLDESDRMVGLRQRLKEV
jgi:hypothetical protein